MFNMDMYVLGNVCEAKIIEKVKVNMRIQNILKSRDEK